MSVDKIIPINISEEMKSAYIDYSMSVIVSRALPDVRDGLKPVQRRVIYGMRDLGLGYNKSPKKSARIVGEVLGKYHPHGDSSVYEAMVRMAQPWSLRYPLVQGQGNFGSMDGDSPAAMRYTEARLERISDEIVSDIEKDTVDFKLNFDDSLEEPSVLPSQLPNLLVNGASGIAVGMATNMLPHNLTEIVNGIIAYIDNNEIDILELMNIVKAPDFPTGGIIYGTDGVRLAFATGRGKVVVRGKTEIEEYGNGRERIIVTEIPYQVNKANLVKKAADLVNEKRIEGISAIRDESDRKGMRIVFELKRDANSNVTLNQLFRYTPLQSSYGVNNVCLVNGRPRILNLKDLMVEFVKFRHDVVVRRTEYDLKKARERAHILEGLLIAIDNLDEVIKLIRASRTVDEAKQALMSRFDLSEIQAKAILDMRLQKLTGLERDKVKMDYDELMKKINHFEMILSDRSMRMDIVKTELIEIRDRFGDERRTDIVHADSDIDMEALIEEEQVVVTISHMGYVKRTSLTEFREQGRGGRGSRGGASRNEDFIEHLFVGSTHDYLLVFTQKGKCYWLKTYRIPEGTKTSKGRAIQNVIQLPADDKVMAYLTIKDLKDEAFLKSHFIMFCTKQGIIKKTSVEAYSRPRQNGINAISIKEGDALLEVKLTNGHCEVLLGARSGRAIRFPENTVRAMGRTASGVRGIRLAETGNDEVVGMICVDGRTAHDVTILNVSENGYGKRTPLEEYRVTNRGGKGVKTMTVTDKTGQLVALKDVLPENGLMIINQSGITIRMGLDKIGTMGRAAQGVRLIKVNEGDEIASVAKIPVTDDGEEETENAAETPANGENTTPSATDEAAADANEQTTSDDASDAPDTPDSDE